MGGKKTNGEKVHTSDAQAVADWLLEGLQECLQMFWIAGSVRRNVEWVGDLDLVVVPSDSEKLLQGLTELEFTGGSKKRVGVIDGIQVDVYIASSHDFGAQLLMWTGPASFNIRMRAKAKRKGWLLNQYGLFDEEGTVIAAEYEEDIFAALHMEDLQPWKRI